MKTTPFRIIACIVLVATLLLLSGLPSTAATLLQGATANSCCDQEENGAPAGPCSTPDCHCYSCITMDLAAAPFTILRATPERLSFQGSLQILHLCEYIVSIDYPPETA